MTLNELFTLKIDLFDSKTLRTSHYLKFQGSVYTDFAEMAKGDRLTNNL